MNKQIYFWGALVTVVVVVISIGVFFYYIPFQSEVEAASRVPVVSKPKFMSELDGLAVGKTNVNPQVVAVMIDNHPDARPAWGLAKAKIVYEVPVEGEFTRYMALYDNLQTVAQVGPVRSARTYFLDWLQEYGRGLYMHSGGSPDALTQIPQRKIFDANEFFWGTYYWRGIDKQSPHNLYTKSTAWQSIINSYSTSTYRMPYGNGWKYLTRVGQPTKAQNAIKIIYDPNYIVSWQYDSKAMNYVRYINGIKYTDADGSEVHTRNILVQYVAVSVLDNEGRKEIITVGTGSGRVLEKGKTITVTWKKESVSGRTRFYTTEGKEVTLLPGTTWVEVVPENGKVELTNSEAKN